MAGTLETATLGGGCFWCIEAVYLELEGVHRVESGYAGGRTENPSYREVCGGGTGHAEVVQIEFDPSVVTYREVLEVFFSVHDPTTPDRQGNDVGSQYRSIILHHSPEQKEIAEAIVRELGAEHVYPDPIVTEVVPFERFWPAEAYHQDYFGQNPAQPYCQVIVAPKLGKFRRKFASRLKHGA